MSEIQREQISVAAERAVLVAVHLPGRYVDASDPFSELRALAQTAGAEVVGELIQNRRLPSGKTYLGKGKTQELAGLVGTTAASLVIFDNDLSPAQIRAVEEATQCKVVDRSELILDIFANRAATHAAKIQVEIAQLEYTYPRLRAMWSHLEQVAGGAPVGIGTRGPGEKQLEIDRRLVQQRLRRLKRELGRIQGRKAREVQRRNIDYFTVGLVGYTNAGKSTLFNRLTAGGAFTHRRLFATLSTRVERWDLDGGNAVMLSDTVGFIHDLPHHLVASFRSTLEETVFAQLLIIVLDVADPNAPMQLETVYRTLDEIGAVDQPRVLGLNKIDLLDDDRELLVWLNRYPQAVPISAAAGDGLDALAEVVRTEVRGDVRQVKVTTPMSEGKTIAFLEKRAEVLDRRYGDGQAQLTVRIGRRQVDELLAQGARIRINGLDPREAVKREWDGPESSAVGRAPTRPD
ncbi:MAG: GTPase HflX [Planctomycetota bacterium]|nr:GTPase HflX [Planctomycetota bacterium]